MRVLTEKFSQFDVVNIPSDGNCQFAAIAFHLGGKTSARDVRQKVVQYLQSTPITPDCPDINVDSLVAETGGNFDSYLTKMSMNGTWGDGLTLAAAASIYCRAITIITDSGATFTVEPSSTTSVSADSSNEPMLLGYIGSCDSVMRNHYVALLTKVSNDPTISSDVDINGDSLVPEGGDGQAPTAAASIHDGNAKMHMSVRKRSTVVSKGLDKIIEKRKITFPWLTKSGEGALCAVCCSFYADKELPASHSGVFITVPFTDWAKSTGSQSKCNKLLKHEESRSHTAAVSFDSEGAHMSKHKRTVYSMVQKQSLDQQQFQLDRMMDFTDCAYFLFRNEIPHTTNYSGLINLAARLDGSNKLQQFMDMSPDNATYTSSATATDLLLAVSQWLSDGLLQQLKNSQYLAILADESTDIRTRNELSVCFRYVVNGKALESFHSLQQLSSTKADIVSNCLKDILISNEIPASRIYWMAFDGAANMSGRVHGVQAMLKKDMLPNANYVHCRSHLLNLAAANVAQEFKPLKCLFSTFNSLWKFFHNSPKRHNQLVEVQKVFNDPVLELVRTGDTRWTSNYRAVRAIRMCLRSLVVTLQDIHTAAADLASEAGGLLLTFQNQTSILLIHALEHILQPLNVLTLQLQSPQLSLATLPEKVELATARLQEIYEDSNIYGSDFQLFVQQENWPTVGEVVDISKVHSQTVQPYITKLCSNLERRFGDTVGKVSAAACVFNPLNVDKHTLPEQQEQVQLLSDYFRLSGEDASAEWVCFRNFLQRHRLESSDDICKHLLTSDVGDSFPQLQKLAGILVCCPVGTASVERSFSTMNRLCNKLRQRLTPAHLSRLLRISQEGPDKLDRNELKDVVYIWHQQKHRRLMIPTD